MTARREQFEAWARSRGFDLDREPDGGWDNYANRGVQIAWEAWDVALDSVVIELPFLGDEEFWGVNGFHQGNYHAKVLEAIRRAGVKGLESQS